MDDEEKLTVYAAESLTVYATRVDDFNDRRYRVSVTVTVPADSIYDATCHVVEAVTRLT